MPIRIPKRFTRLYITALSLIAFLTILGQILVQNTLIDGLNDPWLVNFAGQQRFQSQLIAKTALLLTQRPDLANRNTQLKEFKRVLADWEDHYDQLKTGNLRDISAIYVNSDTINAMFVNIEPHFRSIQQNAYWVLKWMEKPEDSAQINLSVQNIFKHELIFLHKMNQIVFQYDKEAKEKVTRLRRIELGLMALTLAILLLEGWFIFRPAVGKLHETIIQLMDARENTMIANQELQKAYQLLRNTQAQLLETTQLRHQQEIKAHKIRASALLQGQEEERQRLSKELHDGVGQMLTGLKLIAENFGETKEWSPRDIRNAQDLRTVISQTIQEVRTISHNLMPTVLNDFGIDLALKQLIDSTARNTNAQMTFTSNLREKRLDRNLEIGLYRIAQEAINNAVKHSKSTQISLDIWLTNKEVTLRVTDNGKGFNAARKKSTTPNFPTNGLRNLHERAHLLNGVLKIHSAIGRGTEVMAHIPQ